MFCKKQKQRTLYKTTCWDVGMLGLLVADKQTRPFRLEIDWIQVEIKRLQIKIDQIQIEIDLIRIKNKLIREDSD